ncbi:hypothetical protein, partial [Rhizobium sp. Leaf453]|uniref:hypothetical protein n=1 Tax=Rhizobium sp. Leaf453 TaxID=1736380 RepID=UPI001FCDF4A9
DFRIRDSIHANVTLSVPAKCAHIETSVDDVAQLNEAVVVPTTDTDCCFAFMARQLLGAGISERAGMERQ